MANTGIHILGSILKYPVSQRALWYYDVHTNHWVHCGPFHSSLGPLSSTAPLIPVHLTNQPSLGLNMLAMTSWRNNHTLCVFPKLFLPTPCTKYSEFWKFLDFEDSTSKYNFFWIPFHNSSLHKIFFIPMPALPFIFSTGISYSEAKQWIY